MECSLCHAIRNRSALKVVLESEHFVCIAAPAEQMIGHTVIASKAHYETIDQAPPEIGSDFFRVCQALSARFRSDTSYGGYNLLGANGALTQQAAPHLHFDFLPRRKRDGLNLSLLSIADRGG